MGMKFTIPIPKAKQTLEVDYDEIPDNILQMVIVEGLKTLLNAKMSKLTTAKLEGEALAAAQDAVMAKAQENLAAIKAGTYTKGRPSTSTDASGNKIPAAVLTEARRLAKNRVKDALKKAKIVISHVEPKQITAAANELVQSDPTLIEEAIANLIKRAEAPLPQDIISLVPVSPVLVAKAEAEKAARKTQLSAKQAGKVAPRKGSVPAGIQAPTKVAPAAHATVQ